MNVGSDMPLLSQYITVRNTKLISSIKGLLAHAQTTSAHGMYRRRKIHMVLAMAEPAAGDTQASSLDSVCNVRGPFNLVHLVALSSPSHAHARA